MIARLTILLPYSISIPEGEQFAVYTLSDKGYEIQFRPFVKCSENLSVNDPDQVEIDGKSAFLANGLRVHFIKENFDRRKNIPCDPPLEFIAEIVEWFLLRVRFVTQSGRIKPFNFLETTWKLDYLNNDETELNQEADKIRGTGSNTFKVSYTAVNKNVWNNFFELPLDFEPPRWNALILDAFEILPEIGPAIVLAATALEVFISKVLNDLHKKTIIPNELWQWINDRENRLKDPSIEERFDVILGMIAGFSLKKDNIELWNIFVDLKKARNSFVHEGIPKIGNDIVSKEQATKLIQGANNIIKFIRTKLPADLQWPEYKHDIKVSVSKTIFKKS